MFTKICDYTIKEEFRTCSLENGIDIYTRIASKENGQKKTALFIHGGGSGGNHTIVTRASYWMMQKGLFGKMILPDRRGAGLSSPITEMMTYQDNAKDMSGLLDNLGIEEMVSVIGISYGGPIALTLAGIDPRIDEVLLVAASPSLRDVKGIWGFLYRHNLLQPIGRFFYKQILGKLEEEYSDFDEVYDVKNSSELKKLFIEKIKHLPKDRFESLMLENESTVNRHNRRIPVDIKIAVPVYRVIGTQDETWEVDVGKQYDEQIPNIETRYIDGATHKDVFFRAEEFYQTLYEMVDKGRQIS